MDADRFDALTETLGQPRSRRAALAALLAGLVGPLTPAANGKRDRGNRRGNGKNRGRPRERKNRGGNAVRTEAACYSGFPCTPGPGKNLSKCDFSESSALRGKNLKGANLGSANLAEANAGGANFASANLGKACFVDADLTGATINGSTNTGGAIFCRTVMPDGSVNDSGCTKSNRCCQTCIDENAACGDGVGGECCPGTACVGGRCGEPCDVCPSGCPFTTLGPAVDATDDGGTIRICPGTYRTVGVIIGKDLTIVGAGDGPGGTILDGERQDLVLDIEDATVTIRDLTVTRGGVTGFDLGGGIFVGSVSTLTLERVQVTDNANGLLGGGIFVDTTSTLHLRQSAVTNNTLDVEGQGGGIYNQGTVSLDATRVAENVVPDGPGGGIFNAEGGILKLTNGSRVTENRAERGAGVFNQGQVTASGGSTVSGNIPDNCLDIGGGTGCP